MIDGACCLSAGCAIVANLLLNSLYQNTRKRRSILYLVDKTLEIHGKEGSIMIEYSYTELDEDVVRTFTSPNLSEYPVEVIENTYFYAENDEEPDMFLHHIKVIVYEVKHDILTDRMKADFIQYAERWDKGEFQPELIPEDLPIIQSDIDYVRSALNL